MSLETPEKIRSLQTKLYAKAKAEPAYRFYLLYDKVHREDILAHAYRLARSNGELFGLLGYTFGPDRNRKAGHWSLSAKPSKKAVRRLTAVSLT